MCKERLFDQINDQVGAIQKLVTAEGSGAEFIKAGSARLGFKFQKSLLSLAFGVVERPDGDAHA